MKTDIYSSINKIIAFARDNLMLDALDEVYTANRLASLCGVPAAELKEVESSGDLESLTAELKTFAPNVDTTAVADIIMPSAHMIDYWFTDELSRNKTKAFEFIFDLYRKGGCAGDGNASVCDGYVNYSRGEEKLKRSVMLDVDGQVPYTPLLCGNRIAAVAAGGILTADIVAGLGAYASAYGGTIARRLGTDETLCCADSAIMHAPVKTEVKSGAAKVALLDYPVTALSFSGIAKNAVERETTKATKHAVDAGIPCVLAASKDKTGSPVFYLIFADNIKDTDILKGSDALTACGVFGTIDFSPLMPVLEKGTALSTDLFAFKPIYDGIGGVKLGAKARPTLDAALNKLFVAALSAAVSTDADKAVELLKDAE